MNAFIEVRLTPLLKGVPTKLETDSGGITTIANEAGTTLVAQFDDEGFEVNIAISEPLTAQVTIPIDEAVVADLEPFAQACRISYSRPGATVPEALIYGQCNRIVDYTNGKVTLVVQDPSLRCMRHYVRRGDAILTTDELVGDPRGPDKGIVRQNAASVDPIIDTARNTQEQQDRNVPALAFTVNNYGENVTGAPFIEFERLQETWDLALNQVVKSDTGPDTYIAPVDAWAYPFRAYAEWGLYTRMTDAASPGASELGRNLDPADPDNPVAGEVIFDYGLGLDNLEGLVEEPGLPVTHCHVVDGDRKFRVTSADAASSAEIGVFVEAIATDFNIVNGNTDSLKAIADAKIKGWGRPPKHFTCTLRPDDAQPFHYGHAFFAEDTPGDYQIGDFVRVRAHRGACSFSTLARIVAAKFTIRDGLVVVELSMIPAVGGSTGTDPEDG